MSTTRESSRHKLRRHTAVALAVFAVVLVSVEVALRAVEPNLPEPLNWPISNMAAKYEQVTSLDPEVIDVVFLGSSVVFDGVDPRVFNSVSDATAYNAAIAGAISPRSWQWWATNVIVPELAPRHIVIGVNPVDLNSASQDTFWGPLQRSRGFADVEAGSARNFIDGVERWLESSSALFRLRTVLREPIRVFTEFGEAEDPVPEIAEFGSRGRPISSSYEYSESVAARYRDDHLRDFQFGGDDSQALRDLIATLTSEGMTVTVTNMPVTDDFVEAMPDGEDQYLEFVADLESLTSGTGADFLDLGRSVSNQQNFWDPGHLDHGGAEEFSRYLAAVIETR